MKLQDSINIAVGGLILYAGYTLFSGISGFGKSEYFKPGVGIVDESVVGAVEVSAFVRKHNKRYIDKVIRAIRNWFKIGNLNAEFKVNSVGRSPGHNEDVGGTRLSRHLFYAAVDIYWRTGSISDLRNVMSTLYPGLGYNSGIKTIELYRISGKDDCYHIGLPYDGSNLLVKEF